MCFKQMQLLPRDDSVVEEHLLDLAADSLRCVHGVGEGQEMERFIHFCMQKGILFQHFILDSSPLTFARSIVKKK